MQDVGRVVAGIEIKLGKLISQHQARRAEHEKQLAEITGLKTIIADQKKVIADLENKIKVLKLAKSLEKKEGNVEAKLKINELVREIDKCIGLLNT